MHRLSAVLLAGAVLAGCAKSEKASESAAAGAAIPTVMVMATDFAFQAPDTLTSGITNFRLMNHGQTLHHLVLIRLPEGQTVADFQKMNPTGPMPPGMVIVGGPNAASPGGAVEATVDLKPGRYVGVCLIPGADGKPHMMKGMLHELIVVPSKVAVSPLPPTPDITIKLSDYKFEPSGPLTAGKHVIRIENAGPQIHEWVIVKLEPGKTVEQMAQWTDKMEGPPPGTVIDGAASLSTGEASYVTLDLAPGEYGFICFWPDAKDGKPHLMHGMMQQVKVM